MRALVMTEPSTGPDRTGVREADVPQPGPGEVTIDVAWAGINFLDIMARRGDAGYARTWPHVPGLEVAGSVREAGAGVPLEPGRRVAALTVDGGLAEVALVPAALAVPVPAGVALPVAAAAPGALATAMLLLTEAGRFRPDETVLVHSASGGVGSAIASFVPALGGGTLIGTVGSPEKVAAAKHLGYDVAAVRSDDLVAAVRAAAPDGVDIVLDPFGTDQLDTDLAVLAPGGRIVLFGNTTGEAPGELPALRQLIGGNASIAGFSISRLAAAAPERAAAALRQVLDLLADGAVDLPVTEIDSLDDVPAVHQLLAEGSGRGKYVVKP
ncbi:zinc-binding dehydrogenase [Streptomyces bathyalis]|uniref:Zinc-binding dehydrogenase n=1 Tax=Streptomyces bathyalis TaxID=2710756 RepID=A0A7T1TC75_9ACTN|nr:zinc-binding dehydrogenase [Streptomyces bathyalis]QPP10245.1 zinc-binding dehydrogenase [Streptomyces bathyalis]